MEVICPKCKEKLADVEVVQPHISSVHCGLCGHDFGVSHTCEPVADTLEAAQAEQFAAESRLEAALRKVAAFNQSAGASVR